MPLSQQTDPRQTNPLSGNGYGADLARRVEALFQSPEYEPPMLPQVAMEVLALTREPDPHVSRIVDLLESDPVIAGRLLHIANSAVYRGSVRTQTLRDAVVRLGLTTLREMLWQVAIGLRVFRAPGGYSQAMESLRRHATAMAQLARHIAGYTDIDPETAFLCGLLHKIGIAAVLLAVGQVKRNETPPSLPLLWPVAVQLHRSVGSGVARHWGLSPEVIYVIERYGVTPLQEAPHSLSAVLLVAEDLAWLGGYGVYIDMPGGGRVIAPPDIDPVELIAARTALNLGETGQLRREAMNLLGIL